MTSVKENKLQELSRLLTSSYLKLTNSMECLLREEIDQFQEIEQKRKAELAKLEAKVPQINKIIEDSKTRKKKAVHPVWIQENSRRNQMQMLNIKERGIGQLRNALKSQIGAQKALAIPCQLSEIYIYLKGVSPDSMFVVYPQTKEMVFVEDGLTPSELLAFSSIKKQSGHLSSLDSLVSSFSFASLENEMVGRFTVRVAKQRPGSERVSKNELFLVIEDISFHSMFEKAHRLSYEQLSRTFKMEYFQKKTEEKFMRVLENNKWVSFDVAVSELEYFNQISESFRVQLEEGLVFVTEPTAMMKKLFAGLKDLFEAVRQNKGGCGKCGLFARDDEGDSPRISYPSVVDKKQLVHSKCLKNN